VVLEDDDGDDTVMSLDIISKSDSWRNNKLWLQRRQLEETHLATNTRLWLSFFFLFLFLYLYLYPVLSLSLIHNIPAYRNILPISLFLLYNFSSTSLASISTLSIILAYSLLCLYLMISKILDCVFDEPNLRLDAACVAFLGLHFELRSIELRRQIVGSRE